MAYRASAKPTGEIVETYDVKTAEGSVATGLLLGIVIILLVTYAVSVFGGTPPELEPWVWTFPTGAAIFAAPMAWLWLRRRRKMHVVREGETWKLVVDQEVELTFPLTMTGMQFTERMRGVAIYHVTLKLVGREGRAVALQEVRGAIHGPERDWFSEVDKETPAVVYEASNLGDLARIRGRVESLNRDLGAA